MEPSCFIFSLTWGVFAICSSLKIEIEANFSNWSKCKITGKWNRKSVDETHHCQFDACNNQGLQVWSASLLKYCCHSLPWDVWYCQYLCFASVFPTHLSFLGPFQDLFAKINSNVNWYFINPNLTFQIYIAYYRMKVEDFFKY